MKTKLLFFFAGLIFISPAYAATCKTPASVQEVLDCALVNHPDVKFSEAGISQGYEFEKVARQRPNLEMNSQGMTGGSGSNAYQYTEINLAHTIEFGDKRDQRIKKAKANLKIRETENLNAREKVYVETLLSLYRLRQIKNELEVVDDALMSFSKLQKQYRSHPILNPDQKASLQIFKFAENDYRMKRVPLEAQYNVYLKEIEFALGEKFTPTNSNLPAFKKTWPSLKDVKIDEISGGSRVQNAEAELKSAQAELRISQSQAYPDVKIGPSYGKQKFGNQSSDFYGLNLAMPLPIYHRNEGGVSVSRREINRADIALQATRKENSNLISIFKDKYENTIEALKNSSPVSDIIKKHFEIEAMFNRGLVSGTLIIETHRQMFDLTQTQNELELSAVEALAKFYILQGRFMELHDK